MQSSCCGSKHSKWDRWDQQTQRNPQVKQLRVYWSRNSCLVCLPNWSWKPDDLGRKDSARRNWNEVVAAIWRKPSAQNCWPRTTIIPLENQEIVFFWYAPGCLMTFMNQNEAQDHMDTGPHQLGLECETSYDTIRVKWAQHVTGIVSRSTECSKSAQLPDSNLSPRSDDNLSVQGWALNSQKTTAKTSEKVKEFLIAKFNEGLLGGKKANPVEVSMEMQDAKDAKGLALFSPEEWKTSREITNFFSRLSALQISRGSSSYSRRRRESYWRWRQHLGRSFIWTDMKRMKQLVFSTHCLLKTVTFAK